MSRHLQTQRRAGRAPASALKLATAWMRLATALIATAIVVIALTNASGAQNTAFVMSNMIVPASHPQDHFAQCLQDWDAATHMTKREWRDVCQRLLLPGPDDLEKNRPGKVMPAAK